MLKGCRVIGFRVRSSKNRSEHTRYNNTLTRTQILQVSRPTLADSGCVSKNLCLCLHVGVCQRKIYCDWGLMMAVFQKHKPKPSNKAELKVVLQTIWNSLSQGSIDRAVLGFRKRLQACVKADGGHFEHVL